MAGRWRWEGALSLFCITLLPAVLIGYARRPQSGSMIAISVIMGLGIGSGIAGVRRGRVASRVIAGACLATIGIVAAGYLALLWLVPELFVN